MGVDFLDQFFLPLNVVLFQGQERVHAALGFAGGQHSAFDTQFLQQTTEPELCRDYSDRSDHRRSIDHDLVGSTGNEVAARGNKVFPDNNEFLVRELGAKPAQVIVDEAGLDRGAAG